MDSPPKYQDEWNNQGSRTCYYMTERQAREIAEDTFNKAIAMRAQGMDGVEISQALAVSKKASFHDI